jgi:glycosyltransferase involved in cell wall biosynthesis
VALVSIIVATIFASLFCAVVPAILFVINLRRYREPQGAAEGARVVVLIPARNEEQNIAACLKSVLASEGAEIEVLVLDDGSTDRTASIVGEIAAADARVRLVNAEALPLGWNGKQHACWLLAQESTASLLLFLDADVRLAPAAVSRCVGQMQVSKISLLSGFPRQITIGWLERLLLPLIHFMLLGFLPMGWMRRGTHPAFAAGCGQFFLAERDAYFAIGGHAAIRETRHDGLRLPREFRERGYRTDVFDLTTLAEVRMYDSAHAVWMGLAKNATEGIATPTRIVPFTIFLLLGQTLPILLLVAMLLLCVEFLVVGATFDQPVLAEAVAATVVVAFVASYLPRLLVIRRFKQPLMSALLHPLCIVLLLSVEWYAALMKAFGKPVSWRARTYSSDTGEQL